MVHVSKKRFTCAAVYKSQTVLEPSEDGELSNLQRVHWMVMPQTTQTAAILSTTAVSYIRLAQESRVYLSNNYIPAAMIALCRPNNLAQLYQTKFSLGYLAGH